MQINLLGFFNSVTDHELFKEKVEQVWSQRIQGTVMFQVWQKIKATKEVVKQLHHQQWQQVNSEVSDAIEELEQWQSAE